LSLSLRQLVVDVVLVLVIRAKGAGQRARAVQAARYLGRGKSLAAFSEKGALATAERLGVKRHPRITVGRVATAGQKFIQPWEDLIIDITPPAAPEPRTRARGEHVARMLRSLSSDA